MKYLQMYILYSEHVVVWDGVRLIMQKIQNLKCTDIKLMDQEDPDANKEQPMRNGRILHANYEQVDLEQEFNKLIRLTKFQQVILLSCLKCYEDLFNGNIGEWTGPPVDTPLKDEFKTYRAHAFPIPVIRL